MTGGAIAFEGIVKVVSPAIPLQDELSPLIPVPCNVTQECPNTTSFCPNAVCFLSFYLMNMIKKIFVTSFAVVVCRRFFFGSGLFKFCSLCLWDWYAFLFSGLLFYFLFTVEK